MLTLQSHARTLLFLKATVFVVVASIAVACQPSSEEQFARAEAYVASADYQSANIEIRNVLRAQPENAEARMLLAVVSYHLADFVTAENAYDRALSLGYDKPEVWRGLGRALMMQGKVLEAFERVVPNLSGKSSSVDDRILVGDILFALGNHDGAQAEYRSSIELSPSSPGALVGLAMIAAANNDHALAQQYLDSATEKNPGSIIAWQSSGNYLRSISKFAEAVTAFDHAISLEDARSPLADRFVVRMNRISALIEADRFTQAKSDFESLRRLLPSHPILGFLKGRIAYGLGDYNLAQTALERYLARVPDDPRGPIALGAVNYSLDNLRQAEFYLRRALRFNVGGSEVLRLLAETQLRLNKPEEAIEALREAETVGQSDAILLAMLGRAEIGVGDIGAAIGYFEKGRSQNPENRAITLALAAAYLQANRVDDVIALLDEIRDDDSEDGYRFEILLMMAYLRNGSNDLAVAEGDRLIQENPDDANARAVVGAMRLSLGDVDDARTYFESALSTDQMNIVSLYSLANIDYGEGQIDEAKRGYERLLDASPTFVPGLAMLASILQESGELENMQPRVDAALQAAPESVSVNIFAARIALSQKNGDAALEIVEGIRQIAPDVTALLYLEGLALVQIGQADKGIARLKQASSNEPDNADYKLDLARVLRNHGDFEQAAEEMRAFQLLLPGDVRGLPILVESEIQNGVPRNVLALVEEYTVSRPQDMTITMLLGDLFVAMNRPSDALAAYEKVAENDWRREIALKLTKTRVLAKTDHAVAPIQRWLLENPEDSGLRFIYAQILEESGDHEAAVAEYEILREQGDANAVVLNNLAWRYSKEGRSDAVQLAEAAHKMQPDNGSISDTFGWILFNHGDLERALPLLRQAADQSPNNLEIRFHLAAALAESGDEEKAAAIIETIIETDELFPSRIDAERLAEELRR